jgi:tRNA (guanine37-N1)-methyltransferase
MKFTVITLFPQMIEQLFAEGVVGQAWRRGQIEIATLNPREWSSGVHKTVDDRPFGGGDGMIMMAEILEKAVQTIAKAKVIYLSPQGKPLSDEKVRSLAKEKDVILICGRYGGIDQRFINEFVDEELSIGDYVLSGGELAAAVVIDSVSRMLEGVLGHQDSAEQDSFSDGWLEAPHFTRPRSWHEQDVPEILTSGDHKKINHWRRKVGQLVTLKKRPDLFWQHNWNQQDLNDLQDFFATLPDKEKQVLGLSNLHAQAFSKEENER